MENATAEKNVAIESNVTPERVGTSTGSFVIVEYKTTSEPNAVSKTLVKVGQSTGNLRDECSIITPTIIFRMLVVPTFNYVYIEAFHRYYFVKSISAVAKNVWRMELNCDVLMSYKDEILNLECVVGRQEYLYNDNLVDTQVLTRNNEVRTVYPITTTPFVTDSVLPGEGYTYMLSVISQ